jgi:hypothetical protein
VWILSLLGEKMKTLCEIARECNADKLTKHNYTPIYTSYFEHLRDTEITLLEIGVSAGNSMRLWEQYFSKARVHGIDIRPACFKVKRERATIHIGSQIDTVFLSEVLKLSGVPDIIIDDGSHKSHDQITSLMFLFPELKPGGWYVIEDVYTSYNPYFVEQGYQGKSAMSWFLDEVDNIQRTVIEADRTMRTDRTRLKGVKSISFYRHIVFIQKGLV